MPKPNDPRDTSNSPQRDHEIASTYVIQDNPYLSKEANDANKERELQRLDIQDRMVTKLMGGVLPEQNDPIRFRLALDIACGTGYWAIEAARVYPEMSVVGIDISKRGIEYARAQAETMHVSDRVEFRVMNALLGLEFPSNSFDLVNLRFGVSFLRTRDWPKLGMEMLRVAHPGGTIRITEGDVTQQSSSPALTKLFEMLMHAFYRAGYLNILSRRAIIDSLPELLERWGVQRVQTRTIQAECRVGTPEGQAHYEDMKHAFHNAFPFLKKWSVATTKEEYDLLYQQMLDEMQQPDFYATWTMLTAWGIKPIPK